MKDYNGIEIKEHSLVAFNYSGDVRIGRVVRLTKPRPHARFAQEGVVVRHLRPKRNHASLGKNETKVKNITSLCVIEPDELLIHLL